MIIQTVGIIGAGQMGRGIAQVFARAGYSVILNDIDEAALAVAMRGIESMLGKQVAKSEISAEVADQALARISVTSQRAKVAATDLIVEAATENEAIKGAIFAALTPDLGPETLLTTNTSSISITRLAALTDRPARFMGLHFMNPVPKMQLVELIRGVATDEQTYATIGQVVQRLGKTAVSVEDFPGFALNRILVPMINEAVFALHEGVGSIEALDNSLKLGANHPMGPFELADLIGLDTCLSIMEVLHDGFGDPKYRPCPLLKNYVAAGWLGRKSGRGFYDYGGSKPTPSR